MISALADHLWQSTLFGGAAWLLCAWLRGKSAAARHVVWTAASLKFLLPFSALYLIGAEAGFPTPVESQPLFSGSALSLAAPVTSPAMALASHEGDAVGWLLLTLACLWIAGALALLIAWIRDWRAAATLCSAAHTLPGEAPDLQFSDAALEPAVARVLRPVVLLPATLRHLLPRAQFAAVIAHEREHIARRDNLVAHLQRLVETLFWFHPLVWFIGRQIREERERACDQAVIDLGHDPGEYASGILAVCEHCVRAQSPHTAAALSGNLTARIRAILDAAPPVSLGITRTALLLCSAFVTLAAPLMGGALDGGAHRQRALVANASAFDNARYRIEPARSAGPRLAATERGVFIGDTSLRELIALVYGVQRGSVSGNGEWLDSTHYDIHAEATGKIVDPDSLDPQALRGLVTKLLASRFELEIYVNQRCQDPCGPRALEVRNATP